MGACFGERVGISPGETFHFRRIATCLALCVVIPTILCDICLQIDVQISRDMRTYPEILCDIYQQMERGASDRPHKRARCEDAMLKADHTRVGGGLLSFLGQFVIPFVSARISCVSATYQLCISVSALSRS